MFSSDGAKGGKIFYRIHLLLFLWVNVFFVRIKPPHFVMTVVREFVKIMLQDVKEEESLMNPCQSIVLTVRKTYDLNS